MERMIKIVNLTDLAEIRGKGGEMERKTYANTRIIISLAAVFFFTRAAARGENAAATPIETKRLVTTTVDNHGDGAFNSDLKAVEDYLKKASIEKKMTQRQSRAYTAQGMKKATKHLAFVKNTLVPHSLTMMQKMKDPDGMIADGRRMVDKDASSWQGYDYLATGAVLKQDLGDAMQNYGNAVKHAPEMQKDWYRYMQAGIFAQKKDQAKALEFYQDIIARDDNWLAVKSSYLGASMILIGRDDHEAVSYFDKGMTLSTPEERAALYKSGICNKFRSVRQGPEACVTK